MDRLIKTAVVTKGHHDTNRHPVVTFQRRGERKAVLKLNKRREFAKIQPPIREQGNHYLGAAISTESTTAPTVTDPGFGIDSHEILVFVCLGFRKSEDRQHRRDFC